MLRAVIIAALLASAASLCAAHEPASQPTTQPAPSRQERVSNLLALIEGQNPPEVRRAIARELILQQWPESPPRLAGVLAGANGPARIAVAKALAELPQFLLPAYVDPLLGMLADPEAEIRSAAAEALAAYRDGGVIPRLKKRALDDEQPLRARLGAIAALGRMTQREAIEGLAAALTEPDATVVAAALAALEQAAALDFAGDVAAARRWYEETRNLSLEAWQRRQIERLVGDARRIRAQLSATEARLVNVLEANFRRAADAERVNLLTGYLADSAITMRLLGLRLTQLHLAEGKSAESLPAELHSRIRKLMKSSDARERAAAVRTVASFRSPGDAEEFVALLATAQDRAVRLALINGLGYVGDGAASQALLNVLTDADEELATEAVAALGRLAERGALHDESRSAVVVALLDVFQRATPAQVALRERVLWAMGNVSDPSFGPAFAAALDGSEAVAVRQAAARGIAVLNDPTLADALAAAAADSDPGVRKTAIETLARLGSSDGHLQALWQRLTSPPETDEAIRQAAWRGVLALLDKRQPAEIETWLARLPAQGPQQRQRLLELLQRVATSMAESESVDRGRLGMIRARIAAEHAQLDQPAEAIAAYVAALADLHAAGSQAAQTVPVDLLRFALRSGRYDQTIADALASRNPGPDYGALWGAIRAEVEPRLTPEHVDTALAMLAALDEHPAGAWPQFVANGIQQLRTRAQRLKGPSPTSAPATAPAAQP